MHFPLGLPIAAMLVCAVLGAIGVWLRAAPPWARDGLDRVGVHLAPPATRRSLEMWCVSASHYKVFDEAMRDSGMELGLVVKSGRAASISLQSMFMAGRTDAGVPDLATMEISLVGTFFRPPVDGVGFLPLDAFLDQRGERTIAERSARGKPGWKARCTADGLVYAHDGAAWQPAPGARADHWRERLVASRLGPWSKDGRVFGIPFDLHPVTLTWREDLFREAGVDLAAPRTWREVQEACLAYEAYWRGKGFADRRALELKESSADWLGHLLLQGGWNPVDDQGLHLDQPEVAEALAWYASMIEGPRSCGREGPATTAQLTADLVRGDLAAVLTPDWRVQFIKDNDPKQVLKGALRMRPLPLLRPGDAPTSTMGGTMVGITRACRRPEEAFAVIERGVFSEAGFRARARLHSQLPSLSEWWDDPVFHQSDPWYGGQSIGDLYVSLAPQVPRRIQTPATGLAMTALSNCLVAARLHLRDRGEAGLVERCRALLKAAQADLVVRIAHAEFPDPSRAAPEAK